MYYYALTFVVKDRPGIVAAVTKVLYEKGFNIEDSSSTRLREIFTMILMVSHTENYSEQQLTDFFAGQGIKPSVHKLPEAAPEASNGQDHYIISVYGADKPGIVHKITAKLAELGINIIDLQTQLAGGYRNEASGIPVKGAYIMVLEVIPGRQNVSEQWIVPVKNTAQEMGTDITVRRLDVFEL